MLQINHGHLVLNVNLIAHLIQRIERVYHHDSFILVIVDQRPQI